MTQHAPELERALRAARETSASPDALQRLREGVSTKLASGMTPPLSAATATAASPVLLKVLGVLLVAGAGSLYFGLSRPHPRAPAAAPPASSVLAPTRAEVPSPPLQPSAAAPVPSAPVPLSKPSSKLSARTRRISPPTAAPEPVSPTPDPEAEVALITQAQRELKTSASRALQTLQQHALQFPHGILAQERDALSIDAERALGQNDVARLHARQFVAHYPESQEARALERWLGLQSDHASDHKTQPAGKPTP